MKTLILFFLFISAAIAQTSPIHSELHNPDGDYMSIHLTPYLTSGKLLNSGLNTDFCYRIELVAPITDNATFRLFYDYMATTYSDNNNNTYGFIKDAIQLKKTGLTLSYYFD